MRLSIVVEIDPTWIVEWRLVVEVGHAKLIQQAKLRNGSVVDENLLGVVPAIFPRRRLCRWLGFGPKRIHDTKNYAVSIDVIVIFISIVPLGLAESFVRVCVNRPEFSKLRPLL